VNDSLSLVVPVRDAEGTLVDQIHHLLDLLPDLTSRFEILVVDDGSSDHTVDLARDLARQYPQVKLLRHAVPLGTDASIRTALKAAGGETVLVLEEAGPVRAADLRQLWSLRIDAQSAGPPPPRMNRRPEVSHLGPLDASVRCGNLRLVRRTSALSCTATDAPQWLWNDKPAEGAPPGEGTDTSMSAPTRTFREHLRRLLAEQAADEPAEVEGTPRPH
jgi:hypothetical protein